MSYNFTIAVTRTDFAICEVQINKFKPRVKKGILDTSVLSEYKEK